MNEILPEYGFWFEVLYMAWSDRVPNGYSAHNLPHSPAQSRRRSFSRVDTNPHSSRSTSGLVHRLKQGTFRRYDRFYAVRGITAEFLASTGAALIAEPQSAESIRQAITKLLGDDALRAEMGELGRASSSNHIREDVMAAAARHLYSTITDKAPTSPQTTLVD